MKREATRKKPVRKSGGVPSWLWVLVGTVAGGLIMLLVYLAGLAPPLSTPAPAPAAASDAAAPAAAPKAAPAAPKRVSPVFEFYTKLPEGGAATGVPADVAATTQPAADAAVQPANNTAPPSTNALSTTAAGSEALDPIQQLLAEQEKAKQAAVPVADVSKAQAAPTPPKEAASKTGGRQLQAGAFRSKAEVEKLRAKISLAGMQSSVQTVSNAKGETLHRVLVGPFASGEDMDEAKIILSGNGINAIPVR